ncbi:hypothetical protein BaRGS_00006419, partial [Batillaria attramentaria]
FAEKLDDIAEAIQQATFLAVDAEFTGLDTPDHGHTCPFDTPSERYAKMCKGSLDYLIVQFGLCAFKFNEETQSYEARPFNFYIFPRPYTRQAPDRRFLCQSSSIDFLVQQGFDFNKLFREGISYLTPQQEEVMREALNTKHQQFAKFSSPAFVSPDTADMGPGKGPVQVPEEQKAFISSVCEKIGTFVDKSGGDDVLQLDPCNGFQRKLIYQTIRSQFSSVHLETRTGEKKERFIVVTRVASEEELKKKEKDKQNAEIMELEEAVGFAKVMKLISQSGKLVVGHNMLLDVMHMLNQFCCPLPPDLEEFKAMVKECLPRIVDTKLMASTHPFREVISNTSLEELRKSLDKKPFTPAKVELAEEFKRYENATEMYHEAGYDAFVTGCLFATMANYLGTFQDPVQPVVLPSSKLVEPFVNKLFLMRIADIPYMNLTGSDLDPNRDHVFHITFPKEWRSSDINHLFAPFGSIHISWVNDTSAFVALYKKDNCTVVRKALCADRSTYQLVPYSSYKMGSAAPVPSPLSPRKRASADIDSVYSWTNKKRKSADEEGAKPMDMTTTPPVPEEEEEMPTAMDLSADRSRSRLSAATGDGNEEAASKEKMFTEPAAW